MIFSDWPSTAKATGRGTASGVLITVEVFGAGSPPPKDIGARVAASGGVRAVEGRGDRWAEGDHNPLSMLLLRSGALQEDATIGTDRIFFWRFADIGASVESRDRLITGLHTRAAVGILEASHQ